MRNGRRSVVTSFLWNWTTLGIVKEKAIRGRGKYNLIDCEHVTHSTNDNTCTRPGGEGIRPHIEDTRTSSRPAATNHANSQFGVN